MDNTSPSVFSTCRLRLWDRVVRQTMTMNLRLAEYVIVFHSPCDRRSYIIYTIEVKWALYIKARCVGVVYISWYHGCLVFYWYKHPHPALGLQVYISAKSLAAIYIVNYYMCSHIVLFVYAINKEREFKSFYHK